jgi:hypothetical protein
VPNYSNDKSISLKQWIAAVINTMRGEFFSLMDSVPTNERTRLGQLKSWSPKDELAHLVYWLEVFVTNIQAKRDGKPLIDTRDYLAMNDAAWLERKDWSWNALENALLRVMDDLERLTELLSVEELTESAPRPLVRSLMYELVDHPVHHFLALYQKLGAAPDTVAAMLIRIQQNIKQRGVAKWTATSRRKLQKHLEQIR